MKNITLFAMLLLSSSLLAQWPYFQQDHSSTTTGVDYTYPADIQFDGANTVYSYHASNANGTVIVKYATGSGAVTGIVYLSRGGTTYLPVCVRTQGTYYYALFNTIVSGMNRYCLIKLDVATNAVSFVRQFNNPTNNLDVSGADFILDGGSYAYVLGNAYDAVRSESDPYVAKIDVSTATPSVIWSNVYQDTSRDEVSSNIILYNNQLFASFNSVNMSSFLDRGPGLLKLDLSGNNLGSVIYKYSSSCTSARTAGTWVMVNGTQLTLSSISYVGADGNGPMWLANIDPATLVFTLQMHYGSGAAYLVPEIQNVATAAGNRILISGAASFVNTATPGYVHYYFNAATLAFTQGVLYPTTNPDTWGSMICDVSITPGAGKNLFSVAQNAAATNSYHLLKTSDLGDDACDSPVSIGQSSCIMDFYPIAFTTIASPLTLSTIKLFSVSALTDTYTQSCLVVCPICPNPNDPIDLAVNGNHSDVLHGADATIYPNPTSGSLTLHAANGNLGEIRVYTLAGTPIQAPVRTTASRAEIDLSSEKPGIYLIQAVVNGERQNWRVVKQ